jgi:hypothetical protein
MKHPEPKPAEIEVVEVEAALLAPLLVEIEVALLAPLVVELPSER